MEEMPLVSIITPCYNGEKYVHHLLDSILNQTYKCIEFIFVNDGSTDRTEEIVVSYENEFNKKGISLVYIYQQNMGVASAINAGLKIFSGKYLCWPDSDDYLEPTSIEKRVLFLENNQQYGCVSSDAYVYDENNLVKPVCRIADRMENKFDENQFLHLLNEQSIFCPGCHMIRSSAFLNVIPKREIYPAMCGQNWQMLLPVYYKYKRGFIDEPLFNYIIHSNSLSRRGDSLEKGLSFCNEQELILHSIFDSLKMSENENKIYSNLVNIKYARKRFELACKYKDRILLDKQYQILRNLNNLNRKDKINYYRIKNRYFDYFFIFIKTITNSFRKIKRIISND